MVSMPDGMPKGQKLTAAQVAYHQAIMANSVAIAEEWERTKAKKIVMQPGMSRGRVLLDLLAGLVITHIARLQFGLGRAMQRLDQLEGKAPYSMTSQPLTVSRVVVPGSPLGEVKIPLPVDGDIVGVELENGELALYVQHVVSLAPEPAGAPEAGVPTQEQQPAPWQDRLLYVLATGGELDAIRVRDYIGYFRHPDGVRHIFAVIPDTTPGPVTPE